MGLAFLAAWMRSFLSTNDHIRVWGKHSLYSHNGSVCWNIQYAELSILEVAAGPLQATINSRFEAFGISFSDISVAGMGVQQYWISYWYFITPLTLVSAYLLLTKPRPVQQTASNHPADEIHILAKD
jgi:hypothetical protein